MFDIVQWRKYVAFNSKLRTTFVQTAHIVFGWIDSIEITKEKLNKQKKRRTTRDTHTHTHRKGKTNLQLKIDTKIALLSLPTFLRSIHCNTMSFGVFPQNLQQYSSKCVCLYARLCMHKKRSFFPFARYCFVVCLFRIFLTLSPTSFHCLLIMHRKGKKIVQKQHFLKLSSKNYIEDKRNREHKEIHIRCKMHMSIVWI